MNLYESEAEEIIDSLLYEFGSQLSDSDDIITELVARSYCHSWGTDDYQILDAHFVDESKIQFSVNMNLYGEPFDESPTIFDTIQAHITGVAVKDGDTWEISEYEISEAGFGIDYEEEEPAYLSSVLSNVNYFQTFSDEISRLRLLNELIVEDKQALRTLQRQIYIGAITSLETYLLDALVNKVLSTKEFLTSFISKFDFGDRKITLNQLFEFVERAEDIAKEAMLEVRYHNISKVSRIYKAAIGIDFPNIATVAKAVATRHDLVHRNGKTKEGNEVKISKDIVATVITDVESFISEINQKLNKQIAPDLSEDDIEF